MEFFKEEVMADRTNYIENILRLSQVHAQQSTDRAVLPSG